MLAQRAALALTATTTGAGRISSFFLAEKAQLSDIVLSQYGNEFAVGRWCRLVVFVYSASTRWVLRGVGVGEGLASGAKLLQSGTVLDTLAAAFFPYMLAATWLSLVCMATTKAARRAGRRC